MTLRTFSCFAFSSFVAVGCASGTSAADASPGGPESCEGAAAAASKRVADVAAENVACATDGDCFTVALGASCFDACTRSVNQAGKGAVDRAETLVEAGECKPFRAAGCKLVAPPCGPPSRATCKAGRCQ